MAEFTDDQIATLKRMQEDLLAAYDKAARDAKIDISGHGSFSAYTTVNTARAAMGSTALAYIEVTKILNEKNKYSNFVP